MSSPVQPAWGFPASCQSPPGPRSPSVPSTAGSAGRLRLAGFQGPCRNTPRHPPGARHKVAWKTVQCYFYSGFKDSDTTVWCVLQVHSVSNIGRNVYCTCFGYHSDPWSSFDLAMEQSDWVGLAAEGKQNLPSPFLIAQMEGGEAKK